MFSLPDRQHGQMQLTCLIAREIDAPAGVTPIEWRLLTNRPAQTLGALVELIDRPWAGEVEAWGCGTGTVLGLQAGTIDLVTVYLCRTVSTP